MSHDAARFLIEPVPNPEPEKTYLHVFEQDGEARSDAGFEWLPDRTRALRFASREAAQAFGDLHLDYDFRVTGHPAAELVGAPYYDPEDEADDLAAA